MITSPSTRERRTMAAGAIVIGGILLVGRIVPAWRGWIRAERENATSLQLTDAHEHRLLALAGPERDSLRARAERLVRVDSQLIVADTPAEAAAQLAALVADAADTAHLKVGMVQVQHDSAWAQRDGRVTAHISATGDVAAVTFFLDELETGDLVLSVPEFSIAQPEPAAAPDRSEALRIDLTIEALARPKFRTASEGEESR